jgi:hypothetical protein
MGWEWETCACGGQTEPLGFSAGHIADGFRCQRCRRVQWVSVTAGWVTAHPEEWAALRAASDGGRAVW